MKYWQHFELESQRLYAALLSNCHQKDLFLETNRYHERLFFDFASRVLPTDNFLEIGAYESNTSKLLAAKCPQTRCMAFEADPNVFAKFKNENVDNNKLENYEYLNIAMSDHVGEISFHQQVDQYGKAPKNLLKNNSLRTKPSGKYTSISIETKTVDQCLENAPGSLTMRIDVEGLCYEVLVGAKNSLEKTRVIYAEVEDFEIWTGQKTVFDVYDLLHEHGFIPLTRDVETPGQYNVIFVKEADAFRRELRGPVALYNRRLAVLNQRAQDELGL